MIEDDEQLSEASARSSKLWVFKLHAFLLRHLTRRVSGELCEAFLAETRDSLPSDVQYSVEDHFVTAFGPNGSSVGFTAQYLRLHRSGRRRVAVLAGLLAEQIVDFTSMISIEDFALRDTSVRVTVADVLVCVDFQSGDRNVVKRVRLRWRELPEAARYSRGIQRD